MVLTVACWSVVTAPCAWLGELAGPLGLVTVGMLAWAGGRAAPARAGAAMAKVVGMGWMSWGRVTPLRPREM